MPYEPGDCLLFALSAWQECSWNKYRALFGEVNARYAPKYPQESDFSERFQETAFHLDSLGHCDLSYTEGSRIITISPATLARLPAPGLPRAVLCGSRAPETIRVIRQACETFGEAARLIVHRQLGALRWIPTQIEIEAGSNEILCGIAEKASLHFESVPPSWALMNIVGSLDDYLRLLAWEPAPELNWYRLDFDITSLTFVKSGTAPEGRLRLSRYQNPSTGQYYHLLWENGRRAPVDLRWGRYAVLRDSGVKILKYDSRLCALTIPRSVPLFRLFARALVLCSGFIPRLLENGDSSRRRAVHGYRSYRQVPVDLYRVLADKIGQGS